MDKRSKLIALGGAVGALVLAGMTAQVSGQMNAWMQSSNNNRIIELQKAGGSPADDGQVAIAYYGHSAFEVTSPKGMKILVDPWRNDPSGAWGIWYKVDFPMTPVDIGMSTHAHFDHDALDRLDAAMLLDRMAGAFSLADVKITAIADKHVCVAPGKVAWTDAVKEFGQDPCPPNNLTHMDNSLYLIETGGLRLLMWGDNRHNPPEEVWAQIQNIDIAFLPVDGSGHILNYEQADAVMKRLKAKVVVPHHYLVKGTTYILTTLEPATPWVEQHDNTMLDKASFTIDAAGIKGKDGHVIYFGDNNKAAM